MITCYLKYEIDPNKVQEFEYYARTWIRLVEKFGGIHHGYYLSHESANDLAIALFSFPSLAKYEEYRNKSLADAECIEAYMFARTSECIRRFDRQFLRQIV